MRDERTDASSFRAALHELTTMLVYEATRSVEVWRGVAVMTGDLVSIDVLFDRPKRGAWALCGGSDPPIAQNWTLISF